MGIISVEHADQLFWLGRYSERVVTTIRIFSEYFDGMIDLDEEEYEEYCKKQDIPNIYSSTEDFCKRYCFDEEDVNSICSNLMRAYDNAIVLREEIGSDTLSYIQLAVYEMKKASTSEAPLIQLQKVVDNLVAFWGMSDDSIDSHIVRNMIKVGRRIERIDIYARMHMERELILREVKRMNSRIKRDYLNYNNARLMHINYLAEVEPVEYEKIVEDIENLLEI